MERLSRKPLQGLTNIVRFNWHYYVIAFVLIGILFFIKDVLPGYLIPGAEFFLLLAAAGIFISLIASWFIYDHSDLYTLNWLNDLYIDTNKKIVNINAGFDETSSLLKEKFTGSTLLVFDFYDPKKHTEISIERARKAYPAFPGTTTISTNEVPLKTNTVDFIFLILAAHEIRDHGERIKFFKQLANALNKGGKIIVVEHQRDLVNFLAYNFGFFHFFANKTWKQTFNGAELALDSETKLTPFISNFILSKK